MASATVTATSFCVGGGHVHLSITGAKTASIQLGTADMAEPITEQDLETFVRVLCRLCKSGKTVAQTKTALLAGITVTV